MRAESVDNENNSMSVLQFTTIVRRLWKVGFSLNNDSLCLCLTLS